MTNFNQIQLPPDSTGKKLRTWVESVSSVDYHVQQIQKYPFPTFNCRQSGAALQSTNSQFSVVNLSGSGKTLIVLGLYGVNASTTGHAGVIMQSFIHRTTIPTGSVAAFTCATDSSDTIPANTVCGFIASPTSKPQNNLLRELYIHTASIESAAGAYDLNRGIKSWIDVPELSKGIILNPNEACSVSFAGADATSAFAFSALVAVVPST